MKECCEECLIMVDHILMTEEGTTTTGDVFEIKDVNYCPKCGDKVDQKLRKQALDEVYGLLPA